MRRIFRFSAGLVAGMWLSLGAPLAAQQVWTSRASPTTQDVWGVCSGPSGFVAVGTNGTILTSPDGTTWAAQNSGTTAWLVAVTWMTGLSSAQWQFIAVGDQGTILTSPDGVTWTVRHTGGPRLNGINWMETGRPGSYGRFLVAVGESGTMLTSSDGVQWTALNPPVTGWLHAVESGPIGGSYGMAVSGQGGVILASTSAPGSGVSFTTLPTGTTADIEGLSASASDGSSLNGKPVWLAVGSGGFMARSLTNGSSWEAVPTPTTAHLYAAKLFSFVPYSGGGENSGSIAVGDGGTILVSGEPGGTPLLATSPTTQTLYGITVRGGPGSINGIPSGNAIAVAVGQHGTILTSPLTAGAPFASSGNGIVGPGNAVYGTSITLSAAVAGWAPMTYQWLFNGQPLAGATAPTLALSGIEPAQEGSYTLQTTNALGTATFGPYVLQATEPAPISGLVDQSFNPSLPGPVIYAVPQPDGKVIVSGPTLSFGSLKYFGRLNADGSPDDAFNRAAAAAAPFPAPSPAAAAPRPMLEPDGRIMLTDAYPAHSLRLNPDGSPDPTYTPHTIVTADGRTVEDAVPTLPLANGDYLSFPQIFGSSTVVQRVLPTGAIDPTYLAWPSPGILPVYATDAEGRIWTPGDRLLPDGSRDPNFPGFAIGPSALAAQGRQMLAVEDSTIGTTWPPYSVTGGLTPMRFNPDGTRDPSYAPATMPGSCFQFGPAAYGPDGSLYVDVTPRYVANTGLQGGFYQGTYRDGLIRFDPNGKFDPTFSLNVTPEGVSALIKGMAFQGDQLVVWGSFTAINGEARAYLVRLNPSAAYQASRLVNVSTRALAGDAAQPLISGFVVAGRCGAAGAGPRRGPVADGVRRGGGPRGPATLARGRRRQRGRG